MSDFKSIEPKNWKMKDYGDYVSENEIDEFYYKFFNCISSNGESKGFRCPSIDVSRTWAEEHKFILHACSDRSHPKHSVLNNKFPTAVWECPKGKQSVTIPHRYDMKAKQPYIPYIFDLNNKEKGIKRIRNLAKEARIWHYELTTFDNNYRNVPITPLGMVFKGKELSTEEKWNRTVSHNLIFEIDTRRETENTAKRWNFFGDKKDKIIKNAQKMIETINNYFHEKNINNFEWFFSANGLYFVLNSDFVNIKNIPKNGNIAEYYKETLHKWEKKNNEIQSLLSKKKIMYLELDIKEQFVRTYIKAPFSLHRRYDRIVLPLTAYFDNNEDIDLNTNGWIDMTKPKNIDSSFIKEMTKKINI